MYTMFNKTYLTFESIRKEYTMYEIRKRSINVQSNFGKNGVVMITLTTYFKWHIWTGLSPLIAFDREYQDRDLTPMQTTRIARIIVMRWGKR